MGSAQEILKQILPTDENNIHCKLLLRSWSYILHNIPSNYNQNQIV